MPDPVVRFVNPYVAELLCDTGRKPFRSGDLLFLEPPQPPVRLLGEEVVGIAEGGAPILGVVRQQGSRFAAGGRLLVGNVRRVACVQKGEPPKARSVH